MHKLTLVECVIFCYKEFALPMELIVFKFTLVKVALIKLEFSHTLLFALFELAGVNNCILVSLLNSLPFVQVILPLSFVQRAILAEEDALAAGLALLELALIHVAILLLQAALAIEHSLLSLPLVDGAVGVLNGAETRYLRFVFFRPV